MKRTSLIFTGLLLSFILFTSCESDGKDPIPIHTEEENIAPYVRIKGFQTPVAATDIPNSSFEATVATPRDNVASWELSVRLESGDTETGPVVLTTVSLFPSAIAIPYTDIARALGIATDAVAAGDRIRFLGKATSTQGQEFTFEDYSSDITGTSEQLQAFNFVVEIE